MQWEIDNWNRKCDLVYKCQLSALYHRKRERFLSMIDKTATALALLAGTAVMSEILNTAQLKTWAGLAVAAVTLPSIVFSWADKARLHAVLASKFVRTESSIEAAGVLCAEQLDRFHAELLSIEAEEPAELSALTRLCQNELAIARGKMDSVHPLTRVERVFVNFFDMPKTTT